MINKHPGVLSIGFSTQIVYDKASRTSHWRLVREEDVVVQSESAA